MPVVLPVVSSLMFRHEDRNVANEHKKSVCSIVSRYKVGERTLQERGTGYLVRCVGEMCIMTNNHVVPNRECAETCQIAFVENISREGDEKQRCLYLCPSAFFLTSAKPRPTECRCLPHQNCSCRVSGKCDANHLDYTICAVRGKGLTGRTPIPIPRQEPPPRRGAHIFILHTTKSAGVLRCTKELVTKSNEYNIAYVTNTPSGSSGSPIFNCIYELAGMHRAGGTGHLAKSSGVLPVPAEEISAESINAMAVKSAATALSDFMETNLAGVCLCVCVRE